MQGGKDELLLPNALIFSGEREDCAANKKTPALRGF